MPRRKKNWENKLANSLLKLDTFILFRIKRQNTLELDYCMTHHCMEFSRTYGHTMWSWSSEYSNTWRAFCSCCYPGPSDSWGTQPTDIKNTQVWLFSSLLLPIGPLSFSDFEVPRTGQERSRNKAFLYKSVLFKEENKTCCTSIATKTHCLNCCIFTTTSKNAISPICCFSLGECLYSFKSLFWFW